MLGDRIIPAVKRALERCEWTGSTARWALASCVAFSRAMDDSTAGGIAGPELRELLAAAVRQHDATVATYVRQQLQQLHSGRHITRDAFQTRCNWRF